MHLSQHSFALHPKIAMLASDEALQIDRDN
jgi:hypothetical protein